MERFASAYEIASGMRLLFASSSNTGMTISPAGIKHLIGMCDAMIEHAQSVDRTVEELASELLAETAISMAAPINADHAAIARNAMAGLHEYADMVAHYRLTDGDERRVAMGLRVLAGSLRRIATDTALPGETATVPVLGKVS